jgi:hypothetical protein
VGDLKPLGVNNYGLGVSWQEEALTKGFSVVGVTKSTTL